MRIPALLLPFIIAAATVAACSWFSRKDARADARAALSQHTPETAPALSFEQRFNWAAVKQARDKATPADKQYATDAYNYVIGNYGADMGPMGLDTLFLSLQRYPSAEIYLLLGYGNETDSKTDLYYQWYKQYGQDWWEKREATRAKDSTAFFQQYGEDGVAIEYFEIAGRLGLSEGWYHAASHYARQGEASTAIACLNAALDSGFSDVPRFLNDSTFDPIRNLPDALAFNTRLQQKYGEMASYYQKFRAEFTALTLPLVLDSSLKKGSEFKDQFEAFVPEVTTESELKLFGAMERYGPPTYHCVGQVSDANCPYDLFLIEASSGDEGMSRYLHIATYDKQGRRLSFHPVMLATDYRDMDGGYGYSTIKIGNDFVIDVESHNLDPEDYDSETPKMRETVETLKITISTDGKLAVQKGEKS